MISAICVGPTALQRGQPGLSADAAVVRVWLTDHMHTSFKMVGITAEKNGYMYLTIGVSSNEHLEYKLHLYSFSSYHGVTSITSTCPVSSSITSVLQKRTEYNSQIVYIKT